MKRIALGIQEIILNFTSAPYFKLTDTQLENLASQYRIQEYGYSNGRISRERIISQLIARRKAIVAELALPISIIALVLSIIAIFK